MSEFTEDELLQMIQINFQLLAENVAALAKANPDKAVMKLRTTVNGLHVSAAIGAYDTTKREETQ